MFNKKKVILIIGGNLESLHGIKIAKANNYITVVVDGNYNAPAKKFADYFINTSIYDDGETVKKVFILNKKIKIDAVMSLSTDVPLTVSKVAKKLNLNSIPIKAAKIFSNKYLMKNELSKIKVAVPKFFLIKNLRDLKNKLKLINKGVIKPVDNRGARGVYIISKNNKNLDELFKSSKSFSNKKKIILEEYLKGQQLSTESIISNYNVKTVGISDRNYEFLKRFEPSIIENGSDLPSKRSKQFYSKINNIIYKVCKKFRIKNGTIKGDLVIHKNKIYSIEFAPRLSGGYFSSIMIPKSSGINLVELAIKIHLGEIIDLKSVKDQNTKFVTQRFFFPKPGKVKNFLFSKKIIQNNNVAYFECNVKKNSEIKKVTNHTDRAGQVIVVSNTRKKSIRIAKKICNNVKIQTI